LEVAAAEDQAAVQLQERVDTEAEVQAVVLELQILVVEDQLQEQVEEVVLYQYDININKLWLISLKSLKIIKYYKY
jgi:hypothetical protein